LPASVEDIAILRGFSGNLYRYFKHSEAGPYFLHRGNLANRRHGFIAEK
jgi:hypothetical protein